MYLACRVERSTDEPGIFDLFLNRGTVNKLYDVERCYILEIAGLATNRFPFSAAAPQTNRSANKSRVQPCLCERVDEECRCCPQGFTWVPCSLHDRSLCCVRVRARVYSPDIMCPKVCQEGQEVVSGFHRSDVRAGHFTVWPSIEHDWLLLLLWRV